MRGSPNAHSFLWILNPPKFSDTNEDEILRERYISPELRQKIIADLTLKEKNYWWYNRNVII